jgi:hypothetical protein
MSRLDRWSLYSMLKGGQALHKSSERDVIESIQAMSREELEEGVVEFLVMLRKHDSYGLI